MVSRESLGRLPDYPFESHFAEIDGQRMHYVDEGPRAAPVLLMLHGNPTWSFYFRRLIGKLSNRFRCIAPDHIGMGLSSRPDDAAYPHSLARRVADLEALLVELDLGGPLTLILHDWGGLIGMTYAARNPGRVGRLVLLNTGAFRLPPGARVPWQIRAFRGPAGHLLVARLNAFCRAAARWCAAGGLTADVRHGYLAPYGTWPERRAVLRFVEDIPLDAGDRSYPLLEQVESSYPNFGEVPTLLLWGLRDFVFDERFLARFLELLPHATVHRFPNAGHYLLEDAPAEVLSKLEAFLDGSCG